LAQPSTRSNFPSCPTSGPQGTMVGNIGSPLIVTLLIERPGYGRLFQWNCEKPQEGGRESNSIRFPRWWNGDLIPGIMVLRVNRSREAERRSAILRKPPRLRRYMGILGESLLRCSGGCVWRGGVLLKECLILY
jgi:hypothetical protein